MQIGTFTSFLKTKSGELIDRTTLRALAAVLVFNLIVAVIILCSALPHHFRVEVDNIAQAMGPSLAVIWTLWSAFSTRRRSRSIEEEKRPPLWAGVCLAIGALAFAVGQTVWSYYELVLNVQTPFPSWADAGYLTAYPFLFVGILGLPTNPVSTNKRIVVLFESLMFMAGIVTFSWYFLLGPTVLQTGESTFARVLGTLYPLFDLGLISCLLLLFIRSGGGRLRACAGVLAAGLVSVVAIDTIFDYQTLHNTYYTGHLIDLGWTLGYMLLAVAGEASFRIQILNKQKSSDTVTGHLRSLKLGSLSKLAEIRPVLVQYTVVALIAGLLWETSRNGGDHRLNVGVHVGAAVIVALLLLRQFFMLLENQELSRKMAAFNENLEEVVKQRTHELAVKSDQLLALQRLTSAINETLDEFMVMSAAVVHSQSAFNGNAAAVWLCKGLDDQVDPIPVKCVGVPGDSHIFKVAALAELSAAGTIQILTIDSEEGAGEQSFEFLQAPLLCRGVVKGKIGVLRPPGTFKQSELGLLESIGLHVATALDNAKQYWNARDAADRDPVTGLLNHRATYSYLDTVIDMWEEDEDPITVVLTDVDNFRMFNETYGHPAGDDLLCKVAAVLESLITAPCKIGRYSADEFILVMPGFSSEQCVCVAQTIQEKIYELKLQYGHDERVIPVSLSFGIASFPLDSQARQDLIVIADSNLTSAKNTDAHIVALTEMKRAHRELRVSSSFRMLDGMVTAVDNKDRYTRRHSEDVTEFALLIADELGLNDELKKIIRTGGLLHDVGKIGVPDEILRKPSRLDEEEYNVMKHHPTLGALIVGGVAGMEDIIDVVKYHHEQWDGKGYPEALAGMDIPFMARLMAVADAMSAMTTDRPYRKGMPMDRALDQIRKNTGTQFDPEIASAFLRVAERKYITADSDSVIALEMPKAA